MKSFIKIMKALSDPNRVKIIKLLQHKSDMCVCELKSLLAIAQPTVSKHLKILEEAGLVEFRKDGLWVNYSLVNGSANPPELSEILKKAPFTSREQICRKT
jgi:ArsR family transcriptional regulator, arsenate/arsenite/antimonite-responsive transcriptional repressor